MTATSAGLPKDKEKNSAQLASPSPSSYLRVGGQQGSYEHEANTFKGAKPEHRLEGHRVADGAQPAASTPKAYSHSMSEAGENVKMDPVDDSGLLKNLFSKMVAEIKVLEQKLLPGARKQNDAGIAEGSEAVISGHVAAKGRVVKEEEPVHMYAALQRDDFGKEAFPLKEKQPVHGSVRSNLPRTNHDQENKAANVMRAKGAHIEEVREDNSFLENQMEMDSLSYKKTGTILQSLIDLHTQKPFDVSCIYTADIHLNNRGETHTAVSIQASSDYLLFDFYNLYGVRGERISSGSSKYSLVIDRKDKRSIEAYKLYGDGTHYHKDESFNMDLQPTVERIIKRCVVLSDK